MSNKRKRRIPQCARCRSHNTFASVRGHKRQCQWKDCTCPKCMMVTEKRRVTAVRVASLRRERKQRISHRMNMDPFRVGFHNACPWGLMGRLPGTYTTDQYQDPGRMVTAGEPYYNEILHDYRGMYPHPDNSYHHIYPRECLPRHDDKPKKADSVITQSMQSFQREYESFMGKLNNEESSSRTKTDMTSLQSSSPVPHRVCNRPTSPHNPVEIYRSPVIPGDIYQPRMPHENHRCIPMMLNSPLTLPYPCPAQYTEFPFGVCM